MKRLLVSLLAILYLAAGAGFTLREHYCMGDRIGAVIEHPAHQEDTHRCDRCGMIKRSSDDNGCCKDEVKTFKSSPDQTLVQSLVFAAPILVADLPPVFPAYEEAPSFAVTASPAAPAHGPPLGSGVPLYLRVRCLRI